MRTHRVFAPPPLAAGERPLLGEEAHHLARVLRARPGDRIVAFDGEGSEAPGEIAGIDGPRVLLKLAAPRPGAAEPRLQLTLALALLKGDKLSAVVRHATELGAARFALLHTEHADLPRLSSAKLERLRRVAREAAKQSGRARVPSVLAPAPLLDVARAAPRPAAVAHPGGAATLAAAVPRSAAAATLFSGPEGGFAESEVGALGALGVPAVGLGPRILRAETAPLALAAALLLEGVA